MGHTTTLLNWGASSDCAWIYASVLYATSIPAISRFGLDNKSTTYLLSALQDIGAEAVCEGEWHFKQRALTANELRTRLREGLDRNADLADKLVIEVLRPGN